MMYACERCMCAQEKEATVSSQEQQLSELQQQLESARKALEVCVFTGFLGRFRGSGAHTWLKHVVQCTCYSGSDILSCKCICIYVYMVLICLVNLLMGSSIL